MPFNKQKIKNVSIKARHELFKAVIWATAFGVVFLLIGGN